MNIIIKRVLTAFVGTWAMTVVTIFAANVAASEPAELAEQARCSMCHDPEVQRLGPSWAAIADRYRDDPAALDRLQVNTRAGSTGVWGKAPMPPVTEEQLSDTDLNVVLGWVLDR
jgi:cytochrome c